MTVSIAGLTFAADDQGAVPNENYVRFSGYGTYTAADFTITADDGLGFSPAKVLVSNLTDRNEILTYIKWEIVNGVGVGLGTANVEGLKTVAAGTRTYAAHGLTVGNKSVAVDVSVAGPITNDSDFIIEMWG